MIVPGSKLIELTVISDAGKKLYELFNSRKKFIAIDGDFHIALTGDYLMKQILEFLQEKK